MVYCFTVRLEKQVICVIDLLAEGKVRNMDSFEIVRPFDPFTPSTAGREVYEQQGEKLVSDELPVVDRFVNVQITCATMVMS